MFADPFFQLLSLLLLTVVIILLFQRFHLPASIAYLLVGILLSPNTVGPSVDDNLISHIAEFGIVFLLFTIGLNFTMPQIYAMRHTILGLGMGQVGLTTLVVTLLLMACGLNPAVAFVLGAIAAQSSTTVISKQLTEQGESNSHHGRLSLSLSVFQDITAVPFIVVIPVLGTAVASEIAGSLGLAVAKAALAMVLVIGVGRLLFRPFFHLVASKKSAELFTLTVLLVCLLAGFATEQLGLSMAFGAFLAGMVLGDTEFRHQVESTIRPFRDVLLGLFFISVGMLVDPAAIVPQWHWIVLATLLMLVLKTVLVLFLLRRKGMAWQLSWRTGLILAVGGEFGLALLALSGDVLPAMYQQITLGTVLCSMVIATVLIKFNLQIAQKLSPKEKLAVGDDVPQAEQAPPLQNHVLIAGYGRIGQILGNFLEAEKIPFQALDMDASLVKQASLAGEPVFYADAADPTVLKALGIEQARLLLIAHDDLPSALQSLYFAKQLNPDCIVLVRTRDDSQLDALRAAGADEVIPETLEAGMMMVSQALLSLKVSPARVALLIAQQRKQRYQLLHQLFHSEQQQPESAEVPQLYPLTLTQEHPWVGRTIAELPLQQVQLQALVRAQQRQLNPAPETLLQVEDVLVLFGELPQIETMTALTATGG
ncbi:cation:proton antiporter [Rheinheimera soli]|uniref:CPA2 family monovalent cation:H+ antiporter-2 n=1 Tax=Rheinheimera soli TaxID=443616 RepID=A0ABU1VXF9_9GAMM|nr:cation:proton antiporter [Rheinheimera soli]MDR7120412.1 CPA2 family monovalent cation:H+ antiporter-2 [Rheinheimera soli]